jgi:hypothetical protein
MKLGSLSSARPVYYDRNPTTTSISYVAGSVAPHAETQRAVTTIASGKKAFVDSVSLSSVRTTAATVVSIQYTFAAYGAGGGAGTPFLIRPMFNNTVGAEGIITLGGSVAAFASDTLSLYTQDASTGGTYNYYMYVRILLFDA